VSEILKQIIGGIVRNALTAMFTLLIAHHWLTQTDMPDSGEITILSAGIAGVICTLAWSIYQKLRSRFRFLVALNSSHADASQVIEATNKAAIATVISPTKGDIVRTALEASASK
jgi:hypothetical protein